MGGIKRFCLLVFGLAGVLCLVALALPWIGPYQKEAASLMDNDYYYIAMLVALGITGLGVVVSFLRALLTPRKRKSIVVSKNGGDRITVSTKAVSSQATHVVEASGLLSADRVDVDTKRNNDVRVNVRVRPHTTVDVVEEGQRLHDELMQGLATVCGSKIKGVNLQFMEAEQADPELLAIASADDQALPSAEPVGIATAEPPEPPKPKRKLFGFGRKQEPDEPTSEPAEEKPARVSIDDLVIPASVYERAAQAEQQASEEAASEEPAAEEAPTLKIVVDTDADTHEADTAHATEGEVE